MNPSGILFGPNSALNLQGSFTAVTADQVNFTTGAFGTVGTPDYTALVGNPESYSFGATIPGSIVNSGNLSVLPEAAVVLVGGQVINTGTLSTPGGDVVILAVEGGQLVRIEQEGLLLNLEVEALAANTQSPLLPFSPLSLPELLTGETAAIASGVAVNTDGSVTLTGSDVVIPIEAGTAIASGTLDTRSEQGGNITVAGETVGLLAATLEASGDTGGGTIRVGGDYQGEGPLPTAAVTFVDQASTLVADALTNGDGGNIIVWSDVTTRSYGTLSAQGGVNGGDGGLVETSSHGFLDVQSIPNVGANNGQAGLWLLDPPSIEIVDEPEANDNIEIGGTPEGDAFFPADPSQPSTLEFSSINDALNSNNIEIRTVASDIVGENDGSISLLDSFTFTLGDGNTFIINSASDIVTADGVSLSSDAPGLNFDFQAAGQIQVGGLTTQNGNISLGGTDILVSEVLFSNGGSVNLLSSTGSVDVAGVDAGGGAIDIMAPGFVEVGGNLLTTDGNILLQGIGDGLVPGVSVDGTIDSGSGDVTITGTSTAGSGIPAVSVGNTITSADGTVAITGNDGAINVAGIDAGSGNVAVTAQGASTDGAPTIAATGPIMTADVGTIALTSDSGDVVIQNAQAQTGSISIIASGLVQVASSLITQGGEISVEGSEGGATSDISVPEPILSGGGDITLATADGVIAVDQVDATGDVAGGNISLTSGAPDTDTTPAITATGITTSDEGSISVNSSEGSIQIDQAVTASGALSLMASGFIEVAQDLTTQGGAIAVEGTDGSGLSEISVGAPIISNGGDITVTSADGTIGVNQVEAGGGTIQVSTQGSDTTEAVAISSGSLVTSGDGGIDVNSPNGSIQIQRAASGSGVLSLMASGFIGVAEDLTTQGGAVTVQGDAGGDASEISVGAPITSNGGAVTVTSDDGTIAVDQVDAGGGNLEIMTQAADTTEAAAIASTGTLATTDEGTITLTSDNGSIQVGGITAGSGPISAMAAELLQVSASLTTQGGNISLESSGANTTTPAIAVTAPIFSNGGGVTLNSTAGDIEVAEVDAGNPDATVNGGTVDITSPNFVRSTGNILTTNGAPITITHGGDGATPFTVGDGSTNGTMGSINNGADSVPAAAYSDTVSFGDISIVTNAPDIVETPDIPDEVDQDEFECFGECEDLETDFEGDDFEGDGFQEDFDLDVDLGGEGDVGVDSDGGPNGGPDNDLNGGPDRDLEGGPDDGPDRDLEGGPDDRPDRDEGPERDRDQGGFDDRDYRGDVEEIAYEDWDASDGAYADEFVAYFDLPNTPEPSFEDSQGTLRSLTSQVGAPPALMYARFVPADSTEVAQKASDKTTQEIAAQPTDILELVLVTPNGQPKRVVVSGATRAKVIRSVRQLQIELTDRTRRRRTTYLSHAQQLYSWLVAPMEPTLAEEDIAHVSFIMSPGLRSLPLAALHDGDGFIIEKYTVGLMPSLALTDSSYRDIRQAPVLAMGASEFANLPDLPAVPFELETIVSQLRTGEKGLNESFTPQALVAQRQSTSYPILHLATHGEFRPGGPGNSYIQFWNQRLGLDQVRQLQLNSPPLELLVMSACRTALGDSEAELGFAGLAVQAGVKSALASLWQVSDLETAGLMAEFYTQLNQQTYKAEALRQAQLAMLRGEVRVENDLLIWNGGSIPLPPELTDLRFQDTSHPYYWAAFTLVGSPW